MTSTMRTLIALFCSLFLSALARAQTVKPGGNPCALLTKAEVQEAVGSPVADGVPHAGNKLVCDFKLGGTGSLVSILLTSRGPVD